MQHQVDFRQELWSWFFCILVIMSSGYFMLSWAEHEKFITSLPDFLTASTIQYNLSEAATKNRQNTDHKNKW